MSSPLCRLLPYHKADGPWQMAADEVLLETAAAGQASLRFYGWTEATLSLGYFQSAAACRAYPGLADLSLVRRATGGSALVHHYEITYALALPPGLPWQKRGDSWARTMHAIITDALATLDVSVRACGPGEERKLGEVLCFLHQTSEDLLLDGHKVVGSAQRKQRGALLQHGGILLAQSPHTPELPGIHELAGKTLLPADVSAAIRKSLSRTHAWNLEPGDWTSAEKQRLDHLILDRYTTSSWNCKR